VVCGPYDNTNVTHVALGGPQFDMPALEGCKIQPPMGVVAPGEKKYTVPVPLAERTKALSVLPLACWNCGFESRRGHGYLPLVKCSVLSGRGLCDGPIARPEESYRVWCVVVCDTETS